MTKQPRKKPQPSVLSNRQLGQLAGGKQWTDDIVSPRDPQSIIAVL